MNASHGCRHALIDRADLDRHYEDLLKADAVLDVLARALESVNDDQGAVERMTVAIVRERIMRVAEALDTARTAPAPAPRPRKRKPALRVVESASAA